MPPLSPQLLHKPRAISPALVKMVREEERAHHWFKLNGSSGQSGSQLPAWSDTRRLDPSRYELLEGGHANASGHRLATVRARSERQAMQRILSHLEEEERTEACRVQALNVRRNERRAVLQARHEARRCNQILIGVAPWRVK